MAYGSSGAPVRTSLRSSTVHLDGIVIRISAGYIAPGTLTHLVDDKVATVSDRQTLLALSDLWTAMGLVNDAEMRAGVRESLAKLARLGDENVIEEMLERWVVGLLRVILQRYDESQTLLRAFDTLYFSDRVSADLTAIHDLSQRCWNTYQSWFRPFAIQPKRKSANRLRSLCGGPNVYPTEHDLTSAVDDEDAQRCTIVVDRLTREWLEQDVLGHTENARFGVAEQ